MAVIVKILRSFDSSNYWVKDSSYSILLLLLLLLLNLEVKLLQEESTRTLFQVIIILINCNGVKIK